MINAKGRLHTFTIDYTSEIDAEGALYQGSFTTKKLSILDQTKISRRKSELCGGMYCVKDDDGNPTGRGIDDWTEYMNQMIAMLEVSIQTSPQWWNLEEIYDEGLLAKVFGEVMRFENTFRRRAGSEDQSDVGGGSSEGNSEEQHSQSNAGNNAPKVVDKQVQASLDA